MPGVQTDRIEKQVVLRAPRARVWRALTDAREFGQWFGVTVAGVFTAGARVTGAVTHKGYEHLTWDVTIERMEPERVFAWRWKPGAVDPGVDYSKEPSTLVTFELSDVEGSLIGFRFPDYSRGLEAAGYHLHFISADRTRGGHVLGCALRSGRALVDPSADLHVELPAGVDLAASDLSEATAAALRSVEREG